MDDKVVAIRGGGVADAAERQFVEELAGKVRAYVEESGRLPDLAVLLLHGQGREEDEMTWAARFYSPEPRGKVEAFGIASAIIVKALCGE